MYWKGVNPVRAFLRQPSLARCFFINSAIRVFWFRITGRKLRLKKYAGKTVYNIDKANELMRLRIETSEPFMASRYGSAELSVVTQALMQFHGLRNYQCMENMKRVSMCSGLFPVTEDIGTRFMEIMIESSAQIDLLGTFRMIMEDYYIRSYVPRSVFLTHRDVFDFWLFEMPFTYSLRGKTVLVIHPFEKSIQAQYRRREKLFSSEYILPEFELKTIKAVQSIAGSDCGYSTWFDALDAMFRQAIDTKFDIAIIGCGAYGFPLAARLKKAGKTAIHMGGVTQMLFGIKGKRWDIDPIAHKLYNPYWIRPHISEVPKRCHVVEGGCYW